MPTVTDCVQQVMALGFQMYRMFGDLQPWRLAPPHGPGSASGASEAAVRLMLGGRGVASARVIVRLFVVASLIVIICNLSLITFDSFDHDSLLLNLLHHLS